MSALHSSHAARRSSVNRSTFICVRYEDVISTDTPEGVALNLTLAGVGSRFVAAFIDATIQGAAFIAIGIVVGIAGDLAAVQVGATIAGFLVFFGYDIAFETRASGRTPGKRASGLRVVERGGEPVGFRSSSVRNLLRVIDLLPGMYLVGITTILATKHNQRLGDLAAGTFVIRDVKAIPAITPVAPAESFRRVTADWDVSMVRAEDLALIRRFLERRDGLLAGARERVANDLATRLRPSVAGTADGLTAEAFLEAVFVARTTRPE